ncbi:MAG: OmpA family protein, partial [Bacteroidales bacterium]|nr:OmpA family protein [Bacteroidales bacterium]
LIVFISDGMANVNTHQVISLANQHSIMVSCITIGLPIGEQLKTIAEKTNGDYFSDINSAKAIKTVLKRIFLKSQLDSYGKITWKAPYGCHPEKTTQLTIGQQTFTLHYQIPDAKLGKFEVSQNNVHFNNDKQKEVVYQPIIINGNNIELNIRDIENSNSEFFGLKDGYLPIIAGANELKKFELSFSPKDSIRASGEYIIRNEDCPDVVINAFAGGREKLLITHPAGGEEYASGSNVPISWSGISQSRPVDLFYQVQGTDAWNPIGAGSKFKKDWKAANINDSVRIKGRVSGNISFDNLLIAPVNIIDTSSFKLAIFNKTGNEILSLSTSGQLKSWDAATGQQKIVFEETIDGDYAYMPGHNRIVNITSTHQKFFTNRNGLLIKEIPFNQKVNLTSLTHINGKELYVTLSNFSVLSDAHDFNYIDETIAPRTGYRIARDKNKLHVFKSRAKKKLFSIKLQASFQKSILHRTEAILAISNHNNIQVYNLDTKAIVLDRQEEDFYQFSSCSKFVLTHDANNYYVYHLKNGNRVYTITKQGNFRISPSGTHIAQTGGDSLTITDISTRQLLWAKKHDGIKQYRFFPTSSKFLLLKKDSLVIWDLQQKKLVNKIYCQSQLINSMELSPDEQSLLVTCDNVIASLDLDKLLRSSSLDMQRDFDTDISPYFNILTPWPELPAKLTFKKQYLNTRVEKVFSKVIGNPGKHPVSIDSIYIDGADSAFELVSSTAGFSILPRNQADVELRFVPKQQGRNSGRLVVVCGKQKHYCDLEGVGIEYDFEPLSPQVIFSPLKVHATKDTLVPIIRNTGTEPILLSDIRLSSGSHFAFEAAAKNQVLSAGDTLWVTITFAPHKRGRQNTSIHVQTDNGIWVHASHIYGEGIAQRQVIIAGKTIHAISKKPIASLISLTALNTGVIAHQQYSNQQGAYTIKARTDLNYSLDAYLEGYFSSSENINLLSTQTKDTLWLDLELMPLNHSSTITLNNIFFESGKADLLDISKSEMLRLVKLMSNQKYLRIEIHGHTDDIGSASSNMELSRLRALAVKQFLTRHNICKERITIKYFGESQAIDDNATEAGRKANRRVEILFAK